MALLLLNDPQNGFRGVQGIDLAAAKTQAYHVAVEQYPGQPFFEGETNLGWFLQIDDKLPFFGPKPWPIACLWDDDVVMRAFATLPPYLVLFSREPSTFEIVPASGFDHGLTSMMEVIQPHGGWHTPTPHQGAVFRWKDSEGQELTVGHLVKIA